MKTERSKMIGAVIAITGSIVAAVGLVNHLPIPIGVGIAVVCIVIGTAVARGRFSNGSGGTTNKLM